MSCSAANAKGRVGTYNGEMLRRALRTELQCHTEREGLRTSDDDDLVLGSGLAGPGRNLGNGRELRGHGE